jgi:hypothetical protein
LAEGLECPGAVAGWWYNNKTQELRDQLTGIAGIALFEAGNKLGTGASSSEAGAAGWETTQGTGRLATSVNQAVFWSGIVDGEVVAANWATEMVG